MSLEISSSPIQLAPIAQVVKVRLMSGETVTLIRRATYQVDPEDGHSCAVVGSISFETLNGTQVPEGFVVDFETEAQPAPRQYFWSETGSPVYVEGGVTYNLDDSVYSGSLAGYQPGYSSEGCYQPCNEVVYAVYVNTYLRLTRSVNEQGPTYTMANGLPWFGVEPIVTELPAPKYETVVQYIDAATLDQFFDTIKGELVGWAINWSKPFPTICDPTESEVLINDVRLMGRYGVVKHDVSSGTTEAPNLILTGKAAASIVWAFRNSPIVVTEQPNLAMQS